MKLYIHKDTFYDKVYGDQTWWKRFEWLLTKKYKDVDYEIINLHYEDNINDLQIGNDDYCICRFAHYKEDFELSKRVYPILHEKFNGRIWPNEIEWFYYNDKRIQLKFLKDNSVPHLISKYVYGLNDFLKWKGQNNIGYPIVAKKPQGAGAEQVNLINHWKEIDFPIIAQPYINVNHDIRINIFGDKIFFRKRAHHWKTDEKKRFPYGRYYGDKVFGYTNKSLTIKEIEKIKHIGIYLKEITDKHLNSKVMSWDIIDEKNDFKVLEFSSCFQFDMIENIFYYDFKKEKILKTENKLKDNSFYVQEELLKNIIG